MNVPLPLRWLPRRAKDLLFRFLVPLVWAAAWVWRRALRGTVFIAVTGSVGKTTCKDLLAAALATRFRVVKSRGTANSQALIARSLLAARPWHRFAVIEVATGFTGQMRPAARRLRPDIAVVLAIARTHIDKFGSLDAIAADKAELVAALAPGGLAVLNGDDPRVAVMGKDRPLRTVFFGSAPGSQLAASEVTARFPARLSLRASDGQSTVVVRTRLVGTQWTPSVLAALLVARECGVPLADAAAAFTSEEPMVARLKPVLLPSGAVLLRDEYNSSIDSLRVALAVLREASAGRRVLVISDYSDLQESYRGRFRLLPSLVAGAVDDVVLVGEHAEYGRRRLLEAGFPAERIAVAQGLEATAELLRAHTGPGDLVLLRGRATDHISRAAIVQFGSIRCWKPRCTWTTICDECPVLGASRDVLRAAHAPWRASADDGATS